MDLDFLADSARQAARSSHLTRVCRSSWHRAARRKAVKLSLTNTVPALLVIAEALPR